MEVSNFKIPNSFCTSEGARARKKIIQTIHLMYLCQSSTECPLFSTRFRCAECWISVHVCIRKELKASSLKYFVAKTDYSSDFISYAFGLHTLAAHWWCLMHVLVRISVSTFNLLLFYFLHDFLIPLLNEIDTLTILRLFVLFLLFALPLFHHFLWKYMA